MERPKFHAQTKCQDTTAYFASPIAMHILYNIYPPVPNTHLILHPSTNIHTSPHPTHHPTIRSTETPSPPATSPAPSPHTPPSPSHPLRRPRSALADLPPLVRASCFPSLAYAVDPSRSSPSPLPIHPDAERVGPGPHPVHVMRRPCAWQGTLRSPLLSTLSKRLSAGTSSQPPVSPFPVTARQASRARAGVDSLVHGTWDVPGRSKRLPAST